MKTNENLSKVVSTSMALVLCFAMLVFALLMLWGMAVPAHAHVLHTRTAGGTITSSPTSGSAGTTITVTGSNITMDVAPSPGATPVATPTALVTSGSVTFGYSTASDCSSFNSVSSSGTAPSVTGGGFTGTFAWPSGTTTGTTYYVCAQVSGVSGTLVGSTFQVSATPSVSADQSSYTVGDDMTVSGSDFPDTTAVTVKLQSSNGATKTTLGTVNTDSTGAFTQDYTVPQHPLNSVVVIATYGNGLQATSSSFTVKAKASAAPRPAAAPPPAPATVSLPPPIPVPTDTPIPVPTDTPIPVPTDTPTPVPTPTLAPTPTPVPVVNHATSTPFSTVLGGLAIGLGMLLGLGILFVVGRLLLRRYLSPAPPDTSFSGAPPGSRLGAENLYGNTGVSWGQTMSFNGPYPPGNGGFPPGYGPQQAPFNGPYPPGNGGFPPDYGPQQAPFNGPYPPGNGGFAPGPGNGTQQLPVNSSRLPSSEFAPTSVPQEPFPPDDWFAPPNQR